LGGQLISDIRSPAGFLTPFPGNAVAQCFHQVDHVVRLFLWLSGFAAYVSLICATVDLGLTDRVSALMRFKRTPPHEAAGRRLADKRA